MNKKKLMLILKISMSKIALSAADAWTEPMLYCKNPI